MMKLMTEGDFLTSITLKLFAVLLKDEKKLLIIARKILSYEYSNILEPSQFMRKDGLSVLLYRQVVATLGDPGEEYIMTAIEQETKKNIKRLYGKDDKETIALAFQQALSGSAQLLKPSKDPGNIEFFFRFDNLITLWSDFYKMLIFILTPRLNSRLVASFEQLMEKKPLVEESEFLRFNIMSPEFNIEKSFEQEMKNQVGHLVAYIEDIVNSEAKAFRLAPHEVPFCEQNKKGLINVINFIFSRPLTLNTRETLDKYKALIRWELARLNLAIYIDVNKQQLDSEDLKKLVGFLWSTTPNPTKDFGKTVVPISNSFTKRIVAALALFVPCPKECGKIYAEAQMTCILSGHYKRQEFWIEDLKKKLGTEEDKATDKQTIEQSDLIVKRDLKKFEHKALQEELYRLAEVKTESLVRMGEIDFECEQIRKSVASADQLKYKQLMQERLTLDVLVQEINKKFPLAKQIPSIAELMPATVLSSSSTMETTMMSSSSTTDSPKPPAVPREFLTGRRMTVAGEVKPENKSAIQSKRFTRIARAFSTFSATSAGSSVRKDSQAETRTGASFSSSSSSSSSQTTAESVSSIRKNSQSDKKEDPAVETNRLLSMRTTPKVQQPNYLYQTQAGVARTPPADRSSIEVPVSTGGTSDSDLVANSVMGRRKRRIPRSVRKATESSQHNDTRQQQLGGS
ncbi:MAG: hypothetical protein JSR33_08045 [Proteobacteria bacterium]|nr:hypothetical protein [Pseudomonadota bacterium]